MTDDLTPVEKLKALKPVLELSETTGCTVTDFEYEFIESKNILIEEMDELADSIPWTDKQLEIIDKIYIKFEDFL